MNERSHLQKYSACSNPDIDEVWKDFEQQFPSDEKCFEKLHNDSIRASKSCLKCSSSDFERQQSKRYLVCKNCRFSESLTARTIFKGMRKIRAFFAAIYLLEHQVPINASIISKRCDIAYSSALNIIHKIGFLSISTSTSQPTVISAIRLINAIWKRNKYTPAGESPKAEVELMATSSRSSLEISKKYISSSMLATSVFVKKNSDNIESGCSGSIEETSKSTTDSPQNDRKLGDKKQLKSSTLTTDQIIMNELSSGNKHFDTLSTTTMLSTADLSSNLIMLELDGLVERMPGDIYKLKIQNFAQAESNLAKILVLFSNQTFKGISFRYLQIYSGIFAVVTGRIQWRSHSVRYDNYIATDSQALPVPKDYTGSLNILIPSAA